MKKFLPSFLFALVLLTGASKVVLAEELNVNLTVKNNGEMVYSGTIPLSTTPSEDNVLFTIKQADTLSSDFEISNIVNYSFGDYLKCITISGTNELCDNWQYKVNGDSPMVGMDSYVLSGEENIVLYFGDENKKEEPTPPPAQNGASGSYIIPPPSILPPQTTTLVLPTTPEPTPPTNTILEEKIKPVLPPAPKKQIKKINKIAKQNTATVINSVSPAPAPIETPQKSWWGRFWDNIFSIF